MEPDLGSWQSPDITRSHSYRGTIAWTPPTAIYRAYTVLENQYSSSTQVQCFLYIHVYYFEQDEYPSSTSPSPACRYRSRSKVITCDTPSYASDHLYQIWKESIQTCRRYKADTIFKVKADKPWKYRSKVITCNIPSDANDDLCQIWTECKQNCRFLFSRWKPKN